MSPSLRSFVHLTVLLIAFNFLSIASAASIFVTTTIDELDTLPATGTGCSLREAVAAANGDIAVGGCLPGGGPSDSISVPAGTYTLTLGSDIDITSPITVSGASAASTIVQAGASADSVTYRVFHVTSAGSAIFDSLTIRYGGSPLSVAGFVGGGIWNQGTTQLSGDTTVVNNRAFSGGGIYSGSLTGVSATAALTVGVGSSVNDNNSSAVGGGIQINGNSFDIFGVISGNTANGNSGGGIGIAAGSGTISAQITGNRALSNFGGGVAVLGTSVSVTITGSGIRNNEADFSGGGIYFANNGSVSDTEIVGNTALIGGGLYLGGGTLTITNTLVQGNSNGGIYNGFGSIIMSGSRLLFNSGTSVGDAYFSNAAANGDSVTNSCIVGNTDLAVRDPGGAIFNATDNWWGDPAGPGPVGPSANGDTISANIDFSGFKTSAPDGCPVCTRPSGAGEPRVCVN